MTIKENVGARVKQIREKAELSQTQVATFLGVDQSYISKCEKGERQFSVDQLEKLGNLFGVMTADLVNGDTPLEALSFAFRANVLTNDDFEAISEIHKIALNICQMRQLLEGKPIEAEN